MEERAMSTVDSLFASALQLPAADRMRLIEALWETIPEDEAMTLSPEWLAELDRRSAEIDAGDVTGATWEEVREAAMKRLPQDGRQS
jgi:putative addiction module component (TIGR02574 family)